MKRLIVLLWLLNFTVHAEGSVDTGWLRGASQERASSSNACFDDSVSANFGNTCSDPDVWIDFDATKWCVTSTDVDGGGADGDLMCHTPGSDVMTMGSDLDVGGQTISVGASEYDIPSTSTVTANAATCDFSTHDLCVVDLQGSTGTVTITLSNANNTAVVVRIIQGDNGDDVDWSPGLYSAGGVAFAAVTTTEDHYDDVVLRYDGSHWIVMGQQQDIQAIP